MLQSSHIFLFTNHIWSSVRGKTSVSRLILMLKRPKNRCSRGQNAKKSIISPLLILFDICEILTVDFQHHSLQSPKILCQSDYIKMPKLEPNVKKRYFKFSKILFFRGNKRERSTMRHDPKCVIGVVTDLQKKFSPYIAVFARQKKK